MKTRAFHRNDIDGLRGVGVGAVLLFHLGVPGAEAGYLGVDVFFVVSGFVITALLIRLNAEEKFSYWKFVKRRIRRLFPALGMTLLGSLLATALLLPQALQVDAAKSTTAALTATSNFYFNSTSNYFSPSAIHKPLHHTWSLGVEEQFYALWPWFIFLALALKRKHRALFAGFWIGAVTLAWLGAELAFRSNQQAAFFLTHSRAGEFMLGATCAFLPPAARVSSGTRTTFCLLGLALLTGCFVIYDSATAFPGWHALAPTAGVALIIWANPPGPLSLLLSNRVLVGLGHVSYSVYLVHWPLIVYYSSFCLAPLKWTEQLGLGVASIVLGALMWRFVEQPFRRTTPDQKGILGRNFGWFVAALTITISFGAFIIGTTPGTLPTNISDDNRQLILDIQKSENRYSAHPHNGDCFIRSDQTFARSKCLRVDEEKNHLLVVGDSLAASLVFGAEHAASSRLQIHLAAAAGCLPLPIPSSGSVACKDRTRAIFEETDLAVFDAVILLGAFSKEEQVDQIPYAIQTLKGRGARRIIIMGSSVRYRTSLELVILQYPDSRLVDLKSKLNENLESDLLAIDRQMRRTTEHAGGEYLSLLDEICRSESKPICAHFLETGEPYVRDHVHLSDAAAYAIWRDMERKLDLE